MKRLLCLTLLAALLSSCTTVPSPPLPAQESAPPLPVPQSQEEIIERLRTFAQHSAAVFFEDSTKNENYSPLSLSIALSMLAQGAEGETLDQLLTAMECKGMDKGDLASAIKELIDSIDSASDEGVVSIANALFSEQSFPLHEAFVNTLEESFDALAESLPLKEQASVERINAFVSDQTADRIKEAYTPNPAVEEVLLLLNTIYANLPWNVPFQASQTQKEVFLAPEGERFPLFMKREGGSTYIEGDNYTAASLALAKGYAMTFILPDEGFSPQDLLKREDLFKELKENQQYTTLAWSVPKFSFTTSMNLEKQLTSMGIEKAFKDDAEFPDISEEPTFVSSVIQKTFLDVNEEGIEAAAVTVISMATTSAPMEPTPFILDRPFLFAIEDRNGVILFIGILNDPTL